MSKEKNYITPIGYQRLIEEWDHLTKVDRPKVVEVVSWAASLGDRSENADYQYGKKRLREIDRRLRFLNTRINIAIVIDPKEAKSKKVQFGAKVTLIDSQGEKKVYFIVGVDEINSKKGLISWRSPIAKGLMGKEVYDEVQIQTPNGICEFEIESVEYFEIMEAYYPKKHWKENEN